MSEYTEKLKSMQIEVDDIKMLRQKISEATTLKQINKLRMAVVKLMKKEPSLLKEWQAKFWSLKNCPTCGKTRPGLA